MNIFHKLDIHYPGTDIRAAAQGSRLGEGACSLPPSPSPAAQGPGALEGLPCPVPEGRWVSPSHLSPACDLISADLEAAALAAPAEMQA